jgi:hypothetical protein
MISFGWRMNGDPKQFTALAMMRHAPMGRGLEFAVKVGELRAVSGV